MASYRQTLYIGVTNDLQRRVYQHKNKINPNSFTSRYNINRLVYFETFNDIQDALAREKQLKSFRREKKVALLISDNPNWHDISLEWK
ncbi:MAG: GIY-YIG nuclease family protein [Chloroflexi bacterium]|nr:MAG: GIY-YIG nuclease family protein [Chloroflexota bacterium]